MSILRCIDINVSRTRMNDFLKLSKLLKMIYPYLILGLVIRLILMPITLHSDLWAISFSQKFFAYEKVVNIYDYLWNLQGDENAALIVNYGKNFFTYPPLAYFSLGIFGLVLKPFFNADFFNNLATILPNVLSDNRLYWHLFLTKLPYLFFDFGVLWLLTKLFDDEKKKIAAALLWIFNPLNFYTSYMVGQFDILPVFFTMLSLYLVRKNRWGWAAFSLGIGGAYKMFPLFFLPFLALYGGKNVLHKVKLLVLGFLPYFLTILLFLSSIAFRQNVLFSNQSQKMLFAKLPVSGAEYLSVFIVLYIFLWGVSLFKKLALWKWFLLVMLLFFGVTHYHPQWFLWLSPLLVVFWVDNKKYRLLPVGLIIAWLALTLMFEPSLSVGLFSPILNQLRNTAPLSEQLNRYYDVFIFKSLLRSFAAGISLTIAVLLFRDEKTD